MVVVSPERALEGGEVRGGGAVAPSPVLELAAAPAGRTPAAGPGPISYEPLLGWTGRGALVSVGHSWRGSSITSSEEVSSAHSAVLVVAVRSEVRRRRVLPP
jgi:hypothetical protein